MTDTSEDGNYLVRVRAQVMSRDDSSGGWVPLGGGGLSNVSVRKRPRPAAQPPPPPAAAPATGTTNTITANNNNTTSTTTTQQQQQQQTLAGGGNGNGGNGGGQQQQVAVILPSGQQQDQKPKHDYLIFGKRISDDSIVLSCTIKKDFEYNKVMPTFHHWKTGDKKFGLTFQAAADARAFDKGVRTAIEDLLDGFADTSPSSPLPKCPKDVGDDDVFMTLNLPQEPQLGGDSRSSSDSSKHSQDPQHRIQHYIPRDKPLEPRQPTYESSKGENYPYVQLQPFHEYIYPVEEQPGGGGNGNGGSRKLPSSLSRRGADSPPSPKKTFIEMRQQHQQQAASAALAQQQPPPMMGQKPLKKAKQQSVCRYCNQLFAEERNPKGACDYAPDAAQNAIAKISCLWCAQCTFYHCAADAEGDFAQHPCDCASDDSCTRRWCCLALLSMFVPCLWLYPPLKLCHWCGVRCGACGGRHHTM